MALKCYWRNVHFRQCYVRQSCENFVDTDAPWCRCRDASLTALIQSHAGVGTRFEQVRNQCVLIFVVCTINYGLRPSELSTGIAVCRCGPNMSLHTTRGVYKTYRIALYILLYYCFWPVSESSNLNAATTTIVPPVMQLVAQTAHGGRLSSRYSL